MTPRPISIAAALVIALAATTIAYALAPMGKIPHETQRWGFTALLALGPPLVAVPLVFRFLRRRKFRFGMKATLALFIGLSVYFGVASILYRSFAAFQRIPFDLSLMDEYVLGYRVFDRPHDELYFILEFWLDSHGDAITAVLWIAMVTALVARRAVALRGSENLWQDVFGSWLRTIGVSLVGLAALALCGYLALAPIDVAAHEHKHQRHNELSRHSPELRAEFDRLVRKVKADASRMKKIEASVDSRRENAEAEWRR